MSSNHLREYAVWYTTLVIVLDRMSTVFGDHEDRDVDDDDDDSSWWQWLIIPVGGIIILAIILFVIKRCMLMQAAKKIKKRREQARTSLEPIGNQQTLTTTAAQRTVVTCDPDSITFPEPHPMYDHPSPYSGRYMAPPPPYTINMGEAPPAYDAPHHPAKFEHPGRNLSFGEVPSVHRTAELRQFQGDSESIPQYFPSAPPGPDPTALPGLDTSGTSIQPDDRN